MIFYSHAPEETMAIGKTLGEQANRGEIYCLVGDLGVGKTVFTKGFAMGLRVTEHVTSPTFTIVNEYRKGSVPFFHFDMYRITDVDEMYEIGFEDYLFGEGVSFIEWANLVKEIIPVEATWITIKKDLKKGLDYREIIIDQKDAP